MYLISSRYMPNDEARACGQEVGPHGSLAAGASSIDGSHLGSKNGKREGLIRRYLGTGLPKG